MKKTIVSIYMIVVAISGQACNTTDISDTCVSGITMTSSLETIFETKGKSLKVFKGNKRFAVGDYDILKDAFSKQHISLDTVQLLCNIYRYSFQNEDKRSDSIVIFLYKVEVNKVVAGVKELFKEIEQKAVKPVTLTTKMPITFYYYTRVGKTLYLLSHYGLPGYYKNFTITRNIDCIIKDAR